MPVTELLPLVQIVSGILLGPGVLGAAFPEGSQRSFYATGDRRVEQYRLVGGP